MQIFQLEGKPAPITVVGHREYYFTEWSSMRNSLKQKCGYIEDVSFVSQKKGQLGSVQTTLSAINEHPKASSRYSVCNWLAGCGRRFDGMDVSFLCHGNPREQPKTLSLYRSRIKELLDMCDNESCDFAVGGGFHESDYPNAVLRLAQLVWNETGIYSLITNPDQLESHRSFGKHVVLNDRTLHVFEDWGAGESAQDRTQRIIPKDLYALPRPFAAIAAYLRLNMRQRLHIGASHSC